MALIWFAGFSRLTRQYSSTPRKPNQRFRMLTPQKQNPAVSRKARHDVALTLTFGRL